MQATRHSILLHSSPMSGGVSHCDQSKGIERTAKIILFLFCFIYPILSSAEPPRLTLYHFDVNTGDATLIVTPDRHGVLIDAGDRGRGKNPINEFLNRMRDDGVFKSLDYTVVTHYDADHLGGMDEVLENGWYPKVAAFDRGDSHLPPFDKDYVLSSCSKVDADLVQSLAHWGTAAACPSNRHASCQILEYIQAASRGGLRQTIMPGHVVNLDHGIEITAVVVNGESADGRRAEVFFDGRRQDCGANDLSVGLLVKYGDFRYFIGGDLTGVPSEAVSDVEGLIKDEVANIDIYHVNHHGSLTSSSEDLMVSMKPRVAIVSNGRKHNHPLKTVIEDRILSLNPPPTVYLTNFNASEDAWNEDPNAIADEDYYGYDGMIEVAVWRRSYRVYRWRNGSRMSVGNRFFIKSR